MAEVTTVVCDQCGEVAEGSVLLHTRDRANAAKDLCPEHMDQLYENTHTPKRGRKPSGAPKRRRKLKIA